MSYSVVIPTMGRESVNASIDSVLQQTYPAQEIIVVAGNTPSISKKNAKYVNLIENYQIGDFPWSAAHNRNLGVENSSAKFVAFLDDDDLWNPSKMAVQIGFLREHSDHVSISSAKYLTQRNFAYKRPLKILLENQNILEAHYGKPRFFPMPYYTPTPGIVLETKTAKKIPFDETLLGFEDTWWLHELQKSGVIVHQHPESLVIINATPLRSISRDSIQKNVAWARKLSEVNPEYGLNYLSGLCFRNAIIRRNFGEALKYRKPEFLLRDF
jgi:glycosyltransferase involved in cell wall biosynthesis